ncbi:hypothetical protein EVAR_73211_1, partial [Eumeta japonica]
MAGSIESRSEREQVDGLLDRIESGIVAYEEWEIDVREFSSPRVTTLSLARSCIIFPYRSSSSPSTYRRCVPHRTHRCCSNAIEGVDRAEESSRSTAGTSAACR